MSNRIGFTPGFPVGFSIGQASQEFVSASTYPLSFAALGLTGVEGYVFDGSVTGNMYTSAGGALCTASGSDPVGQWRDLSGNDSHAAQATSALRVTYYAGTGIEYIRTAYVAGMAQNLVLPNLSSQAELTVYLLARNSGGGRLYPLVLQDNATGWPAGTNLIGDNGAVALFDGTQKTGSYAYDSLGTSGPIRVLKEGSGSGQASFYVARSLTFAGGVTANEDTGLTLPSTNNDASALGATDVQSGHYEICFAFVAAAYLSAGVRSTIESYITSNTAFQGFCA